MLINSYVFKYLCLEKIALSVLKALLDANADLNLVDTDGRSALHYAINFTTGGYEALTDIEDYLIERGARPDIVDNDGRLPLHYAFYKING